MAQAIQTGGESATTAYAAAFSAAYAAGGDQAKGLAAAIAVVSCEGGASAEAFARALSQSIQQDPETGCTVLVTATTYAYAKCGPTGSFAMSGSSVTKVRPLAQQAMRPHVQCSAGSELGISVIR